MGAATKMTEVLEAAGDLLADGGDEQILKMTSRS